MNSALQIANCEAIGFNMQKTQHSILAHSFTACILLQLELARIRHSYIIKHPHFLSNGTISLYIKAEVYVYYTESFTGTNILI